MKLLQANQLYQARRRQIAATVDPDAHAILILDRAGWHITDKLDVPENITLMFLPPKSLELNPVENIW